MTVLYSQFSYKHILDFLCKNNKINNKFDLDLNY